MHRLVELPLPDYITPTPRATRGNNVKFVPQPATSVNPYKYRNWNKLPDDIVNVTSLNY